ncbi:D-sedoheptulose-7-phosphate isomerase [Lewinella cohaerens]|uniref:D-sedoheptulose-7-phosphate isomerase n=1 Tax=Lewinella cohaerens TaxID=70995 RepID=UPI0003648B96|nr:D-sedoheptulose 7-phosphate isomerase [Lewinella cohaerens]
MIQERIKQGIQDSIDLKQLLVSDTEMITLTEQLVDLCIDCFGRDGKLLFCGNGGSAADAQHLAAEFSGRFYFDRPPLYAEALHVNTSYLTAVGNDYGYEESYARMVKAMGRKGDVLFAMSTSGNSPNILRAVAAAKEQGMTIVGFTGQTGGKLAEHCDYLLAVPSKDTPRIQECHMLVGHLICELVEEGMFG